jgi:hypothetical protein
MHLAAPHRRSLERLALTAVAVSFVFVVAVAFGILI